MRGVPLVAGTWSQCGWAGRLLRLKLESFEKASEVHARQKQPKLPVLFPRRWQGSNLIGRFLRAQANKQKATFRYAAAASVATIPEPRYLVAIDQLPMPLLFRLPPLSLSPPPHHASSFHGRDADATARQEQHHGQPECSIALSIPSTETERWG